MLFLCNLIYLILKCDLLSPLHAILALLFLKLFIIEFLAFTKKKNYFPNTPNTAYLLI